MKWLLVLIPTIESLAVMAMAVIVSWRTNDWRWMWLLLLLVICGVPSWAKEMINKEEEVPHGAS